MEYKKEFKVSDFTAIEPSEDSHRGIMEWIMEKVKNLCYEPHQFIPDNSTPDLYEKSKPHWGNPPSEN